MERMSGGSPEVAPGVDTSGGAPVGEVKEVPIRGWRVLGALAFTAVDVTVDVQPIEVQPKHHEHTEPESNG